MIARIGAKIQFSLFASHFSTRSRFAEPIIRLTEEPGEPQPAFENWESLCQFDAAFPALQNSVYVQAQLTPGHITHRSQQM